MSNSVIHIHGAPAPYACDPENSRGRLYAEQPSPTRSPFQRDRDRIIHSTAFRRLKHKTQVFAAPEGDHYRTRLTHSLEVAQIARSIARSLGLNEDLTETLALAHDLGHPPFGHAGERALARCMHDYGGFDHNAQSLKLVTLLERRYAEFDGLNLSWETLEGLAKHNGPLLPGKIHPVICDLDAQMGLMLQCHGSAESQVAALADDIAYNAHDLDDGLRSGLLRLEQLQSLPLIGAAVKQVNERWPGLDEVRFIHESIRRLITAAVEDMLVETGARIAACGANSADEIRIFSHPVAAFSPQTATAIKTLKSFLYRNMYRHEKVVRVMQKADMVIADLFSHYMHRPQDMPEAWRLGAGAGTNAGPGAQICDFIAGMTDNFAIRTHKTLFDETPDFG